jgi:hypothetical protein
MTLTSRNPSESLSGNVLEDHLRVRRRSIYLEASSGLLRLVADSQVRKPAETRQAAL